MINYESPIHIKQKFLDWDYFKELRSIVRGQDFPYYYYEHSHINDKGQVYGCPKLMHVLYENHQVKSPFFSKFDQLLGVLKVKALIKLRVNMTYMRNDTADYFNSDNDYSDEWKKELKYIKVPITASREQNLKEKYFHGPKTAIMYFSENNGGTKFEDGKFIKTEQNKLLIFPSFFKHTIVGHTNSDKGRVVLNINYF